MSILVIISNGYSVYRKKGRLNIKTTNGENSYPVSRLSSLFLVGGGTITTEAIGMLSSAGVSLCLMSKNFRIKGIFIPEENIGSIVERRIQQYTLWKSSRLEVAKKIVSLKIERIQQEFKTDLNHYLALVDKVQSISELMGYEGLVSKIMFDILSKSVPIFKERSYRPPTDPVNAVLSFVYTLSYQKAKAILLSLSFDPYLSFLHNGRGKHAGFASDLIEPVRPILTRFVMKLFIENKLKEGYFSKNGNKHIMSKEALNILIEEYTDVLREIIEKMYKDLFKILKLEDHNETCDL